MSFDTAGHTRHRSVFGKGGRIDDHRRFLGEVPATLETFAVDE
jgi:hypothetical protein